MELGLWDCFQSWIGQTNLVSICGLSTSGFLAITTSGTTSLHPLYQLAWGYLIIWTSYNFYTSPVSFQGSYPESSERQAGWSIISCGMDTFIWSQSPNLGSSMAKIFGQTFTFSTFPPSFFFCVNISFNFWTHPRERWPRNRSGLEKTWIPSHFLTKQFQPSPVSGQKHPVFTLPCWNGESWVRAFMKVSVVRRK